MAPTATRPDVLSSASALAASLTDQSSALASYYIKVMTKWSTATVEEAQAWIETESARLSKLASRKGSIAGKKLDELKMKQNVSGRGQKNGSWFRPLTVVRAQILAAFKYVETKAEQVKEKAEEVVEHIKQEL